jgi:hypothetical protein
MVGLVVIAGRERRAMTMPVRRDPRTVKTSDGTANRAGWKCSNLIGIATRSNLSRPPVPHATWRAVRVLGAAGFTMEETIEREPYDDEHPSRRAYLRARAA